MNDYNLFDNRRANAFDFKELMQIFLEGHTKTDKLLRTSKPRPTRREVTSEDVENWEKRIIPFYEQRRAVLESGADGVYVFPNRFRKTLVSSNDGDGFARIYIGIHTRYLIEFFSMLEDLLAGEDVDYHYKFFEPFEQNSSDRAVIYTNDGLFKVVEAIEKIKESKPYLFEGAGDKFLTTKVYDGVSIAGDLDSSFTKTFSSLIDIFVRRILQDYQFGGVDKLDSFIQSILFKLKDDPRAVKVFGFNKDELTDYNKLKSYIPKIKEVLAEKMEKFLSGDHFSPSVCNVTIKKPKGIKSSSFFINLVLAFMFTLSKNEQDEIIEKLTNYKLFVQLLPELAKMHQLSKVRQSQISKRNICFFEDELEILKQSYEKFLVEKQKEQDKYLEL